MKIVQINKLISTFGGAEAVMQNLTELFLSNKHTVWNFGFHNNNGKIPHSYSLGKASHYTSHFPFSRNKLSSLKEQLQAIAPDFIIIHNTAHSFDLYQLLTMIKKIKIPTIGFLHDYKCICPTMNQYRNKNKCQECSYTNQWPAIMYRCLKGRIGKSAFATYDTYRTNKSSAYALFNLLISPSDFLKNNIRKHGFPYPVKTLRHFTPSTPTQTPKKRPPKDTILFLGQLEPSKGVLQLLKVAAKQPDIQFILAGKGSLLQKVANASASMPNVTYCGFVQSKERNKLLAESTFLIIPSMWDEVLGMVILEAMAQGCPVIGAANGGIPELISKDTGFIYSTFHETDLFSVIEKAKNISNERYVQMSKQCIQFSIAHSPSFYYKNFMQILAKTTINMGHIYND